MLKYVKERKLLYPEGFYLVICSFGEHRRFE